MVIGCVALLGYVAVRVGTGYGSLKAHSMGELPPVPREPASWIPFLFRIDVEPPSYLFGTIHHWDPALATLPELTQVEIERSHVIATEVPLGESDKRAAATYATLPNGRVLSDMISRDALTLLTEECRKEQIDLGRLQRFKPWAIAPLFIEERGQLGQVTVDQAVYNYGKSRGRELFGIESIEEQVAVLDGLNEEEQERLLVSTLKSVNAYREANRSPLRELLHVYMSGDEEALLDTANAQYADGTASADTIHQKVIVERSRRMAERVAEKVRDGTNRRYFFAFGAMHLVGEDGVPGLLRKAGIAVQRIHEPAQIFDRIVRWQYDRRALNRIKLPFDNPLRPTVSVYGRSGFLITDGGEVTLIRHDEKQITDVSHPSHITVRTSTPPSIRSLYVASEGFYYLDLGPPARTLFRDNPEVEVHEVLEGIEEPSSLHGVADGGILVRGRGGLYALRAGKPEVVVSAEQLGEPSCEERALAVRKDGVIAQLRTCGGADELHVGGLVSGRMEKVREFGRSPAGAKFALAPTPSSAFIAMFGNTLAIIDIDGTTEPISVEPPIPTYYVEVERGLAVSSEWVIYVVSEVGVLGLDPTPH